MGKTEYDFSQYLQDIIDYFRDHKDFTSRGFHKARKAINLLYYNKYKGVADVPNRQPRSEYREEKTN